MLKAWTCACACAGFLVLASVPSGAQEVIHALTGTVSAINSATKTISVLQDNGSNGTFNILSNPKTRFEFDKKIEAETTSASSFQKQGDYTIVFYYGGQGDSTVVALKSLGAGPFTATIGTVEKFESRSHSITVQDKSGATHTFTMNAGTVAETGMGVEQGLKFQVRTGDQVRVVGETVGGNATALFIRAM
jgi:hypothetical protein